uniref:Galectin n=1 Tax=Scleropages formosus TaxID=113540 RepID=A0A8C9R910_SCLFO
EASSNSPPANISGMWQGSPQSGGPSWPEEPGQPFFPGQQIIPPSSCGQQPGQPDQQCFSGQAAGQAGQIPSIRQLNPLKQLGWLLNPGQSVWPGQPGGPAIHPGTSVWPGQGSSASAVPYNMNLPRGFYDRMLITMNGAVKPNANKFAVDLLRGHDIALHLNPRFNEAAGQVIVRNHKVANQWGKEERDLQSPFPFMKGQPFEILCTYHEFKVAVNNTQVLEFKHRIKELNQINRINIFGDITLASLSVDNLP